MRELKSLNSFADLDTQRPFAPSSQDEAGIFVSKARDFAGMVLAWSAIVAVSASMWFSAFRAGVALTHWMGH